MKRFLAILLVSLVPFLAFAAGGARNQKKKKADKNTAAWYYELEAYSAPYRGSCNVKVWSYGPDINTARDQATKNAVHGVLFRGVPGNPEKRLNALPPVVSDIRAEETHKEFFEKFFENGGPYQRYATKTVSSGNDEILKYGRKNYKVGVVVTVQYDALRKALEEQGINDSLTSGFAK